MLNLNGSSGDALLYLAQCPSIHLFLLCLLVRVLMLLYMVASYNIPALLWSGNRYDTTQAFYDDTRLTEVRTWDAVHFYHMAAHGYTHENNYVFFPLVPGMIRLVTYLVKDVCPLLHYLAPVSFYCSVINMMASALSAVILRRLTIVTFLGSPALPRVGVETADDALRGAEHVGGGVRGYVARRLAKYWVRVSPEQCRALDDQVELASTRAGTILDDMAVLQQVTTHQRWRAVGGAILFWIFTPAMVFTVAVYTESLFSLFSFLGVYCVVSYNPRRDGASSYLGVATARERSSTTTLANGEETATPWRVCCISKAELKAIVCFFIGATARSNGFLFVGFMLYPLFLQICFPGTYRRRWLRLHAPESTRDSITRRGSAMSRTVYAPTRYPNTLRVIVLVAATTLLLVPFGVMSYFGFSRHAHAWPLADRRLVGNRFWKFYGVLQKKFWNVGFLTAYTVLNSPNVLVGAPIGIAVAVTSYLFVLRPLWRRVPVSASATTATSTTTPSFLARAYTQVEGLIQSTNMVYLWAQCGLAFTIMHIQVVNRFVMSAPALYWLMGMQFAIRPHRAETRALMLFMISWNILGGYLFPNHLPWT